MREYLNCLINHEPITVKKQAGKKLQLTSHTVKKISKKKKGTKIIP